MKKTLLLFFFFYTLENGIAQQRYSTDYFRSPVDFPITLAGNFGEIRPNHFHAGFDIRTANREGAPIFAAADGYVSRIKISSVGYGKAIYVTHPNGYVSVYGHLKEFTNSIYDIVQAVQTKLQSFEIDTLLLPSVLPIKKGQQIAWSGNTGSSQAPHLHFEIRDAITEKPINPYYFGFSVKDVIKPVIKSIAIYPLNEDALVNGKKVMKQILPLKINNGYGFNKADTITVHGKIGFGINCYDTESNSSSPNGIYSLELQLDNKRIYYYEFETFSFDNARYVNAHIDYSEKQKHQQTIQKCFLAKNNLLGIYKAVQDRGIVDFKDAALHHLSYIVKDYQGNISVLNLNVRGKIAATVTTHASAIAYDCLKENQLLEEGLKVIFPAASLYDDVTITYKKSAPLKGTFSFLYQIGDETIALQKAMQISIDAEKLPTSLKEKACIISINKKGSFDYEGGTCINGNVETECKHLGKFAIAVDTIAPKISSIVRPAVCDSIADLRDLKTLKFRITDNLSGIKKYRATIDGKWVLCEYDAKNELLFHVFDKKLITGLHYFKLEVSDDKGNKRNWELMFKK